MNSNQVFCFLMIFAIVAQWLEAGDPNSVVDYYRSSGRDASLDGRAKDFAKLFPGESYRGTAQQNERLLGVVRTGDLLANYGEQTMNVFAPPVENRTDDNVATMFGGWLPNRCRTEFRPASNWFESNVDKIAQTRGSCCGINARCEHVQPDCFQWMNRNNRACAEHDRGLDRCGTHFFEGLWNPCASEVNRKIANAFENDPVIKTPFSWMTLPDMSEEAMLWRRFPEMTLPRPLPSGEWGQISE